MQKLLNVEQEFTARCGMQINVKKTYLLVIDNDKKRWVLLGVVHAVDAVAPVQ